MKGSIHLGTYFGIPVYLHWTFFLLLGYIVYDSWQKGMEQNNIIWFVFLTLVIFVCVTLHEFGHALTARKYNIKTKDIILSPIGGVARLKNMPKFWHQEFLVAIAGPAVNVIIAIILLAVLQFTGVGFPENPERIISSIREHFIFLLLVINVFLVVFNLIPAFPMDGGRVFRALLTIPFGRMKATLVAARVGQVLAVAFMGFSLYQQQPFHLFIGVFIFFAASAELRSVKYEQWLESLLPEAMGVPAKTVFTEEELYFHPDRSNTRFWILESLGEPQQLIELNKGQKIYRPFVLIEDVMAAKEVIQLKRAHPNECLISYSLKKETYIVITEDTIQSLFNAFASKRNSLNRLNLRKKELENRQVS
jgi:Zn-dependent protease